MKITKMAEGSARLKIASEMGSQARGDTGLNIWMIGLSASIAFLDIPIKNPTGMATIAPSAKPINTRLRLASNNQPSPKLPGPR